VAIQLLPSLALALKRGRLPVRWRSSLHGVCHGSGIGILPWPCPAGGRHFFWQDHVEQTNWEVRKEDTMRSITKIVAYYRLSTPMKGKSKSQTIREAYGLEDQRRAVAKIAAEHKAPIIGEFTEIMTGTKRRQREKLAKAISMVRLYNATLVVARQSRLARSVRVINALLESGIDFVSADCPDQTRQETLSRAIIDEEEARRISDRTKAGLKIAKEKGVKLGSARPGHWDGREHLRGWKKAVVVAAKVRHEKCLQTYRFLFPIIRKLLAQGQKYPEIAEHLNEMGHSTGTGKPFHPMAVCRVLKMFNASCRRRPLERCCMCGQAFEITSNDRHEHEIYGRPFVCPNCADDSYIVQHAMAATSR
jgi:DNA invertase Pin-like site-specific DNA recombinase